MQVLQVSYSSVQAPKDFTRSLKETGFAVINDHPISHDLIFEAFQDWEDFFESDQKFQYTFKTETQEGYFPFKSENAKGAAKKDLKEFYHVYPWSKLPKGMSDRTWKLRDALSTMAGELLGWIEDNSPDEVKARYSMPLRKMIENSPKTLFRIIHYPPITEKEEGAIRAAAHEDINMITLLPSATAPGLQVQDVHGKWHDVPCDPGSIVVNSGDMLKMASGEYFGSTTHRVINPTGPEARKPRFSMPLFLHPWPEVKLSTNTTADDYLNQRLREIGLKS